MTTQELKVSIINQLIYSNADDNSLQPLWKYTYWDKKFKNVDRKKQPKIMEYVSVLARDFQRLEDNNGNVYILSTGLYKGFTSKEKLGLEPSFGEVVSIPGGGSASVKYWKGYFVTADNRIATSRDTNLLDNKYLFYCLECNIDLIDSFYRGTGLKHPDMSEILEIKIPIYPIEQQKGIVNKIEELLPIADKYGELCIKLDKLNEKFPIDMEMSILQYALQGKLVKQIKEEGTGEDLFKEIQKEKNRLIKEKLIKAVPTNQEIGDDEKPFDIPSSWKWVRLQDVGELSRGKSKHRPRNDPKLFTNGKYPFIQTGDVAQTSYHITKYSGTYNDFGLSQSRMWPAGTLCLTIAANIGDVAILDFNACFPDSVVGFNAFKPISNNMFFLYGLMCYKTILDKMSRSTAQKNINIEILSKVAFPLPPLKEQERIVAKIEELLPLCRKLTK